MLVEASVFYKELYPCSQHAGQAQDNETFSSSISSVPDLVETAQTQLGRGASPLIALTAMEIAMRNIVGAAHVYNADATSAYQEGVTEARLVLKVRVHAIHASRLRLLL